MSDGLRLCKESCVVVSVLVISRSRVYAQATVSGAGSTACFPDIHNPRQVRNSHVLMQLSYDRLGEARVQLARGV